MRWYSKSNWKTDTHFCAVVPQCSKQLICLKEIHSIAFGSVTANIIARENSLCYGLELVMGKSILRRKLRFFRKALIKDDTQVYVVCWQLKSRSTVVAWGSSYRTLRVHFGGGGNTLKQSIDPSPIKSTACHQLFMCTCACTFFLFKKQEQEYFFDTQFFWKEE